MKQDRKALLRSYRERRKPAGVFALRCTTTGQAWVHWQDHAPGQRVGRPISYDEFVRRTGVAWLPQMRAAQGAGGSLTALR